MSRQEIEMSLLHDTRRLVRFRKPRIRFARIHVDRFQSRRSETLPVKGLRQDLEIPQASLRSMSSVHPKRIYKFTSFHDFRLLFSKLYYYRQVKQDCQSIRIFELHSELSLLLTLSIILPRRKRTQKHHFHA